MAWRLPSPCASPRDRGWSREHCADEMGRNSRAPAKPPGPEPSGRRACEDAQPWAPAPPSRPRRPGARRGSAAPAPRRAPDLGRATLARRRRTREHASGWEVPVLARARGVQGAGNPPLIQVNGLSSARAPATHADADDGAEGSRRRRAPRHRAVPRPADSHRAHPRAHREGRGDGTTATPASCSRAARQGGTPRQASRE